MLMHNNAATTATMFDATAAAVDTYVIYSCLENTGTLTLLVAGRDDEDDGA